MHFKAWFECGNGVCHPNGSRRSASKIRSAVCKCRAPSSPPLQAKSVWLGIWALWGDSEWQFLIWVAIIGPHRPLSSTVWNRSPPCSSLWSFCVLKLRDQTADSSAESQSTQSLFIGFHFHWSLLHDSGSCWVHCEERDGRFHTRSPALRLLRTLPVYRMSEQIQPSRPGGEEGPALHSHTAKKIQGSST